MRMASMALFQAKRKMTAIEKACVPVHTAFDAGEVPLGGTMELWIAGVECIVMEAISQKHLGGLN